MIGLILFLVKPVFKYTVKPVGKYVGWKLFDKVKAKFKKDTYVKVEGTDIIDVKRFYLPIKLNFKCPHCGSDINHDFNSDYLSYPQLNTKSSIGIWCRECDKESEFDMTLEVGIKVNTKKIRKLKEK